MNNCIEVTCLVNAGVLLQYQGIRILVDGIHNEGNYPFSKVPESFLNEMCLSEPPTEESIWRNIDYLIFSHSHPDHFSPHWVAAYLEHNGVSRILIPKERNLRTQKLYEVIDKKGQPVWELPVNVGENHGFLLTKGILVQCLCLPHTGAAFSDAVCNMILITLGYQKILFLGDCDETATSRYAVLQDTPIDLVFVNPYFFASVEGQDLLTVVIQPEHIIIYHIPFEEDDNLFIRSLVRHSIQKYSRNYKQVEAAQDMFYHFTLKEEDHDLYRIR